MDDWKISAITRLKEYDAMTAAAQNLPTGLALCRRETRQELHSRLNNARQWVALTNRALGALTPQEQLVLRMLYIAPQKGNVNRLCELLGCEQATVYRRRDKALQKFTMALYGKPLPAGNLGRQISQNAKMT